MTITVVANPTFSPPRNEITVAVTAGDTMTNPAVSRIVNGVAQLIRQQPAAGLDTRTVYDYEAPRDVPCTYEFVTDYLNPAGTTVWDETWASLSAWQTGSSGNPASSDTTFSVSGGKVVWTQANPDFGGHDIYRTMTAGSYRVTIASMAFTNPGGATTSMQVYFYPSPLLTPFDTRPILQLQATAAGTLTIIANYPGGTSTTTATAISTSSTITVDFLGTSIAVSGSGGTWTSAAAYTTTNINQVHVAPSLTGGTGGIATFTVGEIKVTAYPVSSHLDQLSSPVTLSPAAAWLIHPSNPGLSIPVSSTDRSAATIRVLGDVGNAGTVTEHKILGQQYPITTTSGPRQGNKLQAVVGVRSAAQEQALMGLLADGTPLLFRAPAGYPIGLEEGFYSVGDITRARISQRLGDTMRNFTLPLTQVQSPVVAVQNTGWSWAALAAAFPTWAAVAAAYNTWADVLTNNRKPGY